MADNTGAPHFIPYVEPTDLVREYPAADEASAFAVAAALDAAGGLVAVKSAIFTGVQTDSVTAGGNVEVTDLTITHEVADPANKLIISANFGVAGHSGQRAAVGIAVFADGSIINPPSSSGDRTLVASGGQNALTQWNRQSTQPSFTYVHTPGAGEKVYTVRAINIFTATATVFINRDQEDLDNVGASRAVSSLVISEVKV